MQYPQQHGVKGNNPYGSGNYPFSTNMTSCIGPHPNHASSHMGMNDNFIWPSQSNSVHTANSNHMGLENNSLGHFHANVTCSYPVPSTTHSENFLDSILSSEETPKNFTHESDQGICKSSDKYSGIFQNTSGKDQVDITSTTSVIDESIMPKSWEDEITECPNPCSQSIAEQCLTSKPTPTSQLITTGDIDVVHTDIKSDSIDLLSDDLKCEETSISQNETEKKSRKRLDNMMRSTTENTEPKDVQKVVYLKLI